MKILDIFKRKKRKPHEKDRYKYPEVMVDLRHLADAVGSAQDFWNRHERWLVNCPYVFESDRPGHYTDVPEDHNVSEHPDNCNYKYEYGSILTAFARYMVWAARTEQVLSYPLDCLATDLEVVEMKFAQLPGHQRLIVSFACEQYARCETIILCFGYDRGCFDGLGKKSFYFGRRKRQ